MKKILFLFASMLTVVFLISCEEAFDPMGDFNDQYVLNCIIKIDTTFQIATISRSNKADIGYSTTGNIEDQSVFGAKITLICSNFIGTEVYHFRDTIIENSNDKRYKTPIHFYYLKNFNPSITSLEFNPGVFRRYGYNIKIEAVLPDGKKLTAVSGTNGLDSTVINRYKQENPVNLEPEFLSFQLLTNSQPELLIKYSKLENGNWIDYEKLIPRHYSIGGNAEIPNYPMVARFGSLVQYDTIAIRKTLQNISAGDPNKQNYVIKKIVFMLNVLDGAFASHLSSQQTFKTDFSYRETQPDYTNISGGLGVFGVMYTIKMEMPLQLMIRSLGYRTN
ncbi:hypothetical protein C0389_07700 [bacterium]|nr:hypothetical protein [bacterium]